MSGALRYDSGKVSLLNLHPLTLLGWAEGQGNIMAICMIKWFFYNEPARFDSIGPNLDDALQVLEGGSKKYAIHNYTHGMLYSRVMASFLRHWAVDSGHLVAPVGQSSKIDAESGFRHSAHAECNWYFADLYGTLGYDGGKWDDRTKWQDFAKGVTK